MTLSAPVRARNRSASVWLTSSEASARFGRHRAHVLTQQPSFAGVDPAHERIALARIAFELGAIDIDKVHDRSARRNPFRHILRHLAREAEDVADPVSGDHFVHPIAASSPAAKTVASDTGCPLTSIAAKPALPLRLFAQLDMARGKQAIHLADKAEIACVVGESADMHRCHLAQMFQYMVRPDLVAPVGGPRDAMGKEQYLAHQPSPLAIHGPSRLATDSGSFCQSAICARYFGLFGFMSRGSCRSAVCTA